jgi:LPXTG-site transpeptidase (sortase) family protein
MSLYRYRKAENYKNNNDELIITYSQDSRVNAWNTVGGGYSFLQKLVNSSKLANLIIPTLFIVLGGYFIFKHISPTIKYQIEKQNNQFTQGTTTPISDSYIDISKYISNPSGLIEASELAFKQEILQVDEISKNYKGIFYISIPSIGIDRLPVKANVDSTTESVYNTVLKDSLAHFENTGLPISEVQNNIVVYGHSASSTYNPKANDPEVAFSFLSQMKVGDEIYIDLEGQRYKFRMYSSKEVEPNDLSIITGNPNQRTLTLFTCSPAGNPKKRLVIVARPID